MVRVPGLGNPRRQSVKTEEGMTFTQFDEPVLVFVGLSYPLEIESVAEAHTFLAEWPHSKRDTAHEVALTACRAALADEIDSDTARAAFAAFAKRHRILAPEENEVIAARATGALPERPTV
jgi:hypothetical protein